MRTVTAQSNFIYLWNLSTNTTPNQTFSNTVLLLWVAFQDTRVKGSKEHLLYSTSLRQLYYPSSSPLAFSNGSTTSLIYLKHDIFVQFSLGDQGNSISFPVSKNILEHSKSPIHITQVLLSQHVPTISTGQTVLQKAGKATEKQSLTCIQTGTQLYQGTSLPKHLPAAYKGANRHKCWFSFPCYTRAP